jgi:flagellar protein FlaI
MASVKININPNVPALPKIEDKTKINVRYTLISPYVSVHIYWDKKENELVYDVEEPILDENEKILLDTLEKSLSEMINVNVVVNKELDSMLDYIEKTSKMLIHELAIKISDETFKKVFYYLFRDFVGMNEIEPLMRDYFIEDVECNGLDTRFILFIEFIEIFEQIFDFIRWKF